MSFYYRNTATGAAVQSSIELDQQDLVAITEEEHQLLVNPPPAQQPEETQFDRDVSRYKRRAAAKDMLLAEMAAENMARVRAGVWTVQDLTALMNDPLAKQVMELVNALSFEMAADLLSTATNPMITPEIRDGWVAKLQAHLYLTP
ncbi:hypothetical protein [Hydrogenophaga pseudoflava]|uniref:hypothetical protein n=1 Tax=Hydrogenophaga pseudoflava TaxID=47421 RepID=UPI0027E3FF2D|nr:hypothetical protein [Hydrogenophaga pseudoflava]MDQ7745459.1 hypothetical protein [Hydrogenophaga pseudoflava]